MLPESGTVLICVSGGADSMCLFEAMRHISYERGFSIAVAHYNHKLRGDESDRDETFVLNICEEHDIPFYSGRGDVTKYAKLHGKSIEEAARDMRYEFFFDTAEFIGADKIATAHTMDDNAETIIFNLTRGAGANGMSGIPPVRDKVIRPLLKTSREEIMEFINEREILYVEDSTNDFEVFTRNKIRKTIIPLIKEINPRFNEAASTAAEIFRADEEFIDDIAALFIRDCCAGLTTDANDLAVLPFSVSSRVIKKLYGGSLSYNHIKDVLDLCINESPSAAISLPKMTVYREYERIVFDSQPDDNSEEFAPVILSSGDNCILLGLGLKISCIPVIYNDNMSGSDIKSKKNETINTTFTSFVFKSIDICGKISVRPRMEGDNIKLKGQNGTKSLKKLFIEKRIPVRKRSLIPVICDDEGVLGIYKIGTGSRAIPNHGDKSLLIQFDEV